MESPDCMGSQLRRGTCVERARHECRILYEPDYLWLGEIGDCSYGIFYVHMAVLTVVGKFIQNDDWYLYCGLRFTMTSIISFAIVLAGQKILKSQKKLLRFIGFI